MEKSILVFTNGEKLGDGIIKLPLLHEIKKRLPNYLLIWMTNKGKTVYNSLLQSIAAQYIDEIIEQADLNPFFWQDISNSYNFQNKKYEYILDTQKAIFRTFALKRIKCEHFISAAGNGLFSSISISKQSKNIRQYYLDGLFNLLNVIKPDKIDDTFKINIPEQLEKNLALIFKSQNKYIGIAPGAGEKNKIWPIEKFIEVGKYFEKKSYIIVLYLGPDEIKIKHQLIAKFPKAVIPEDIIKDFSNIEIVMGSTKFINCAVANDSGIAHMLSTKYCPVIKLFGHKDSNKFTPQHKNLIPINSSEFNSRDVKIIPTVRVIREINKVIGWTIER